MSQKTSRPRTPRALVCGATLILVLLLSACSSSASNKKGSSGGNGGQTAINGIDNTSATPAAPTAPATNSTPTPLPPPPSGLANCSQAPGFGSAGSASAGGNFPDVSFPGGSVSAMGGAFSDGHYSFQIVNVCSNGAGASGVRAFYATALTTGGWSNSSTYPYAGDATRACGDPYCWRNPNGPTGTPRYVSLESVNTSGSVAIYSLRLAIAPAVSYSTVVRYNSGSVGQGSAVSVNASCVSTEQMLGGGYYVADTNQIYTASSNYPSAQNTWTATVYNNTSQAMTLWSYVICLQATFPAAVQIVHSSQSLSAGAPDTAVSVTCPGGIGSSGGGYQITTPSPSGLSNVFVDGSQPTVAGWQANAWPRYSNATVTTYALCPTRNLTGGNIYQQTFTVSPHSTNQTSLACSSGQVLTSGGYASSDASGNANNFFYLTGPSKTGNTWFAEVYNRDSGSSHNAVDFVRCMSLNVFV